MNARSLLLLVCATTLLGCKKESEHAHHDDHEEVTVDLRIAFPFTYGAHVYELASEYTDDFGHLYKLDHVRFLLSNLHVVDDDYQVLASFPGMRLLVDASQPPNDFALGALTASHAHQVRFTMGLDEELNRADPDTCAAPLSDTTMHWGMGPDEGFWFLVLEGRVDSDNSGAIDGSDATFTYRCGTDVLTRTGWAMMHADLPDGGTFTAQAPVDIERIMAGVDVYGNSTALGDTPLNVQLMDSLRGNFQEAH